MKCALGLFGTSVQAHPGRTDSNGGHTCRTNCEKWGLSYGQYHYHNNGSTSSGSTQSKGAPDAPTNKTVTEQVVQKKVIVAVDQAPVRYSPNEASQVAATLWYGYGVSDLSGATDGYVNIDQGYLAKTLLVEYVVSTPSTVTIATDKGYFFSIPDSTSKARGSANKGTIVHVVGEANGFYYGSTVDGNGDVLVGFVSKSVVK
ncbi:YHYH domain-containing protein [Brevibacillus sp. AY1]|uniref:YHYH domain-containing protein n=1 Tax=Brevibacillus sp. AY1 TaxID=2807621 RepID=UPI002457C8EB|nr:YHYH domain-containing protein [Brevibacillus sp. AY1]MDH4619667.1 YHYH domain-containing protein [Brevibacillus sp. AY1]